MFNQNAPQQGSLLISEPFILDPNFERSVVVLCEHNQEGTLGLVLNHLSNVLLSDIIAEITCKDFPVYIGGPVQNDALFFLHCTPQKISGGTPIGTDLFWGGDLEQVLELIDNHLIYPQEIKFFLGYSGWSVGQLEEEIKQNSWAVHNSFEPELTFLTDGETLWKQALISLGPKYAHVANFPKSPYLN
ncbi:MULTISPECIES: YqgE/AlgH family protein [Sphingobacterium]|uniref:YqgE/AlgH family protein n=1 Tax=Sphingobacterium TaxID=28453 RepID=UPI0013D95DAC|nr:MULTISPECIES: YqgE/AlgH family protein [unclassified Sphingobacterium]